MKTGLYDLLLTEELDAVVVAMDAVPQVDVLRQEVAADYLAAHVWGAARKALDALKGKDKLQQQLALANRLIEILAEAGSEIEPTDRAVDKVLRSLMTQREKAAGSGHMTRPGIPLRHSDLIVNGPQDLRVGLEIAKELPSADQVDMLMSFIKFSGFVELKPALAEYLGRGRQLRVLTTSYMDATDARALDELQEMGADIRVSFDKRRTRLHAKAWLFHRATGFSTGLVGSSNLSYPALRDGCEWNVRLSQRDNGPLLSKFEKTFEQYWNDPVFEPYERARFVQSQEKTPLAADQALVSVTRIRPFPHQQAVLDALEAERQAGHMRNLVIAATGTGKTVISALDYARQDRRPSLLFVAHRDRILEQARATFRVVLQDAGFGEKHTGRGRPDEGRHVFASVQSLHAKRLKEIAPDAFDMIIVDEFHHAAANTYQVLLEHFRPKILLGLTATPERTDGQSVLHWFDDRVAAESRLWDALDQNLLVPFQYFGIHDGTDLSQIDFRGGRYDVSSLEQVYTADEYRATQILRAVADKVHAPSAMKALGFCVTIKHAEYMVELFEKAGLPSAVVTGATPPGVRERRIKELKSGKLVCLFTVDVFNEGVDIPCVDTVLFLRPTESSTIFLQQLGRGLRLDPSKACLTVLDFVGNANQNFRFDQRFRALTGVASRKELRRQVEEGFPTLPSGCAIQLEEQVQEIVLRNLKRTLGWNALKDELRRHHDLHGFLRDTGRTLEELYFPGKSFALLRWKAGHSQFKPPSTGRWKALAGMVHVNDDALLAAWEELLESKARLDWSEAHHRMLFAALDLNRPVAEAGELMQQVFADEELYRELLALVRALRDRNRRATLPLEGLPLRVHGHYSRFEVMAALDLVDGGRLKRLREGVLKVDEHGCDLMFVTLDKDSKDFTPSTLYNDYAMSSRRFHWESQSGLRESAPTARRYMSPPEGWRHLLFVRQAKKDERGVTGAFLFLGPVRYVEHEGERPMAIVWELEEEMPPEWFGGVKVAAG